MGDRQYGGLGSHNYRTEGGNRGNQPQRKGTASGRHQSSSSSSYRANSNAYDSYDSDLAGGSAEKSRRGSEIGHEYPNKRPMPLSAQDSSPHVYSYSSSVPGEHSSSFVNNSSQHTSNYGSNVQFESSATFNRGFVHNPPYPSVSQPIHPQQPYMLHSMTTSPSIPSPSMNTGTNSNPNNYYDPLAPPAELLQAKKSSLSTAVTLAEPKKPSTGASLRTATTNFNSKASSSLAAPSAQVTPNKVEVRGPPINKAPGALVFSFETSKPATTKSSLGSSRLTALGSAPTLPQTNTSTVQHKPGGQISFIKPVVTPKKSLLSTSYTHVSEAANPAIEALPKNEEPHNVAAASSSSSTVQPPSAAIQQHLKENLSSSSLSRSTPINDRYLPTTGNLSSQQQPIKRHKAGERSTSNSNPIPLLPPAPIVVKSSSNNLPNPSKRPEGPPTYGVRTLDSYTIESEISEGAYGIVFKATDKISGETVALKRVKVDPLKEKEAGFPLSSVREIRALAELQHEHVVGFRDLISDDTGNTLYLVLDFVEHDLHQLLKRHLHKTLSEPLFSLGNVKSLVLQLLTSMAFLHSKNFMHRDIKSSNLLLSSDGKLYLADFGLAKEWKESGLRTPTVVTISYRAPELVFEAHDYNIAIDMWSVGLIMAELLTGREFIRGVKTEFELVSKLCEIFGSPNETNYGEGYKKLKIVDPKSAISIKPQPENKLKSFFPNLSRQGFDLLSRMLCYNPDTRITAAQALAHPWFKEYPIPVMPKINPIDGSVSDFVPSSISIIQNPSSSYANPPPMTYQPYNSVTSSIPTFHPSSLAPQPHQQQQQPYGEQRYGESTQTHSYRPHYPPQRDRNYSQEWDNRGFPPPEQHHHRQTSFDRPPSPERKQQQTSRDRSYQNGPPTYQQSNRDHRNHPPRGGRYPASRH
jgi:cell division cycle 2-like protein